MTEKEKLEYLAYETDSLIALAGAGCPSDNSAQRCRFFDEDCLICWRCWLLGDESRLCYIDSDSLNPDLPEDMY